MRNCKLIISLLSFLIIALLIVVFVSIRYCTLTYLQFDSSEFNNIVTPIISLVGVVGLIYTIYISLMQIKFTRSERYYASYVEKIEKISKEENSELMHANFQVLDYLNFVDTRYDILSADETYMTDLERYKSGESIDIENKSYKVTLEELTLMQVQSNLLQTAILRLIKEIKYHKQLDKVHKELILESIVNGLIINYLAACSFIQTDKQEFIDTLYIGLKIVEKYDLKFFNKKFFQLYEFVRNDKLLFALYNK